MSLSKLCPKRFGVIRRMFHSSSHHMKASKFSATRIPSFTQSQKPSPWWRKILISTAVVGGLGGGFLFLNKLHKNDEKRQILTGQNKNDGCSSRNSRVVAGPFSLIDSNGKVVTEKDVLGKDWTLLHFGYTSSPDVGPAELEKLTKATKTLESKHNVKVQPVFVTIDPQRDTPSHLRAYLKEFDAKIVGLTGPVGAIRQMAHEYRVFYKKVEEDGDDYLVESSHNMYLMNPKMEIVRTFGLEYNADQLSEEIHKEFNKP